MVHRIIEKYIWSENGRIFRVIADDPVVSRHNTSSFHMPYQYVIQILQKSKWHNVYVSNLFDFERTTLFDFIMTCHKEVSSKDLDMLPLVLA